MIALADLNPPIEKIQAHFVQYKGFNFILSGDGAEAIASRGTNYFGPSILGRYGVAMATRREFFFPARTVDDYGCVYDGQAALDWIVNSGLRHPRADAIGLIEDGSPETLMLRQLDLGVPLGVFVSARRGEFPGIQAAARVHIEVDDCRQVNKGARARDYMPVVRIPAMSEPGLSLRHIVRQIEALY